MKQKTLIAVVFFALLIAGTPLVDASISGYINKVWWPSALFYKHGESVKLTTEIRNSGTEKHQFWVGCSVQDPTGKWWDIKPQSVYLPKGDRSQFKFTWAVPSSAPSGYYTATVALWRGYDYSTGRMVGELDRETKSNAFRVK